MLLMGKEMPMEGHSDRQQDESVQNSYNNGREGHKEGHVQVTVMSDDREVTFLRRMTRELGGFEKNNTGGRRNS
jgi:hypothetical protein